MKELDVLNDRSAGKWAHPEMYAQYETSNAAGCQDGMYDFDVPFEERKKKVNDILDYMKDRFQLDDESPSIKRAQYYCASGCEEEPETSVEVVVYRPQNVGNKKLPAMLYVPSGGMYLALVEMSFDIVPTCDRLNCVIVCPKYRTAFEGKYPAAINDCHAAWNWMVANAEMLNIDSNKILLYGMSSGSNLALSLAHRLKRFNQKPCGCVVQGALADNRPMYPTSKIFSSWTADAQWKASLQYLGMNNVFCNNEPEMYPMYATPEQCVGLCPTFIHADAEDANSSACRAYQDKLTEAGVYNELHCWGGSSHCVIFVTALNYPEVPCGQRYLSIVDGNIRDCWEYDLTREWINNLVDSYKIIK